MESDISKAIEANNAGVEYYKKGKIRQAIDSFKLALKHNPSFASALYHLGLIYYKTGKYTDAVNSLRKAKALGFNDSQLNDYIALAEKEVKGVDEFSAIDGPAINAVKQKLCPSCGEPVDVEFNFCPSCRYRLSEPKCENCGVKVKKNWKICPYCGTDINNE